MRLHPLLLATGALSAAVAPRDCLLNNRREMAADASCPDADSEALALCFSNLPSSDAALLADCYVQSGCSVSDAVRHAETAQDRCRELFPGDAELRRRRAGEPDQPQVTQMPRFASADLAELWARSATSGDACLTTFDTKVKDCPVRTVDGNVETASGDECSDKVTDTSSCADGKTCSMDSNGEDICMDLQNGLDIAGIIISIIFGVLIVLGIATLTWLCCKDRKEQKRMAAKAEATALARAATKKKKAADAREQRAPLMERKRDASQGSTDPFHDRNRS